MIDDSPSMSESTKKLDWLIENMNKMMEDINKDREERNKLTNIRG